VPGGLRGLQNRRRCASGEVGSIPALSASAFLIFDCRFSIGRKYAPLIESNMKHPTSGEGVNQMSREQIRKLTSLSSCAG